MKIFKFGGASVKDAESVRNVALVLQTQGFDQCLLVVSAMGKTTNALEIVVQNYFGKTAYSAELAQLKEKHFSICAELFNANHPIFQDVSFYFTELELFLDRNKSPLYNFVYDQVVGFGELLSSKILSAFLNDNNYPNWWCDSREFIKTDSNYREGNVNWSETERKMKLLPSGECIVTQGFIGSDENNFMVTLGREGSDYSAAIFAYCLDADTMTIWKDVPGVMTGDPRKFENVSLLKNISYEDAIEMAYYGASIIHPKTLQPLQQKKIPFFVKSFLEPQNPGTRIGESEERTHQESFILKENQHLMRIATRDFSFIAEEHMSLIFALLAKHKIKISLMQNSAISLDLCLEDTYHAIEELAGELQQDFKTEIIKNVSLYTIRNANLVDCNKFYQDKKILLEQFAQKTVQVVTN